MRTDHYLKWCESCLLVSPSACGCVPSLRTHHHQLMATITTAEEKRKEHAAGTAMAFA